MKKDGETIKNRFLMSFVLFNALCCMLQGQKQYKRTKHATLLLQCCTRRWKVTQLCSCSGWFMLNELPCESPPESLQLSTLSSDTVTVCQGCYQNSACCSLSSTHVQIYFACPVIGTALCILQNSLFITIKTYSGTLCTQ